jgi:hypothetical protein
MDPPLVKDSTDMHTHLLLIQIRCKRDALLARRQARQVASLLGFNPAEQACTAALVFELATQALTQAASVRLRFAVAQDRLLVCPEGDGPALRVEKPLPPRDPAVPAEDLSFVVRELAKRTAVNLFEEVQKQNQELLRTLLELRDCRAQLAEALHRPAGPAAA